MNCGHDADTSTVRVLRGLLVATGAGRRQDAPPDRRARSARQTRAHRAPRRAAWRASLPTVLLLATLLLAAMPASAQYGVAIDFACADGRRISIIYHRNISGPTGPTDPPRRATLLLSGQAAAEELEAQRTASGTLYANDRVSIREHQGSVTLTTQGANGLRAETSCARARNPS